MSLSRAGGILLHPTSLPGPNGIGDLGPEAYRFVDFLSRAGCHLWQILPLGPTGYGDSPYQSFSAFAGNPYLISPDLLLSDNLLTEADLEDRPEFSRSRVDFGRVIPWKLSILERAFGRFRTVGQAGLQEKMSAFCAANKGWLDDYALFMSLKEFHGGGSWVGWADPYRRRDPVALQRGREDLDDNISRHVFYQFIFFRQWFALRDYAHAKSITIIGDIPIFVAADSADVWSHPELFFLDDQFRPTVVAGVPPDIFSPQGQLWGNPLYNWKKHQETGYSWWLERFKTSLRMVDLVRLDHFRGFAAYWEIPAGLPTAEVGRWVPGPGADLFEAISVDLQKLSGGGSLPIIAEDLGLITEDVIQLRERFDLPGMRIMQFGFSGPENLFLPHNYVPHCVAYTGIHDNDTSRGWFLSAPKAEREYALTYLDTAEQDFTWDLIRAIWSSVASFAIAPMQDVLDLGGEARMNYPSRLGGNWEWRLESDQPSDAVMQRLNEFNYLYLR
jgi:4-alpha-glucanotransferase